jgi:hypothetical protein
MRNDADILDVSAVHPEFKCVMDFEPVRQDRRQYYRLRMNGQGGGSLTDLQHARETVAYWREKGWLQS